MPRAGDCRGRGLTPLPGAGYLFGESKLAEPAGSLVAITEAEQVGVGFL